MSPVRLVNQAEGWSGPGVFIVFKGLYSMLIITWDGGLKCDDFVQVWSASVVARCISARTSSTALTPISSRPSRTTTSPEVRDEQLVWSTLSSPTCSWSQVRNNNKFTVLNHQWHYSRPSLNNLVSLWNCRFYVMRRPNVRWTTPSTSVAIGSCLNRGYREWRVLNSQRVIFEKITFIRISR